MYSKMGFGHAVMVVVAIMVAWNSSSCSSRNVFGVEAFGVGGGPLSRQAQPQRAFQTHLNAKPKGCAAKPYEKKQVAVFGAGGYLGGLIFGFLQRASSLYGTGLGGMATPRAMGATSITLQEVNRVLLREFKLAFAGEDLCRLNNMKDASYIAGRLKGMDAAVLGTVYQLETRSVTGNTYETTPNDKTLEFYLDDRYAATPIEADMDTHLTLFQNTIEACQMAGLKKLVVIETPQTPAETTQAFSDILQQCGIPFTYIHSTGNYVRTNPYTFESGIQNSNLILTKHDVKGNSWMETRSSSQDIAREDIAAIVVQSLQSLDWETSCRLEITSNGNSASPTPLGKKARTDREWCVGVQSLAEQLSSLA